MKHIAVLFIAALVCAAGWAQTQRQEAQLNIEGYARATPPGAPMSVAYLVLRNRALESRELRAVSLPGNTQASASLHTTVFEGGVSRMRALESISIPAQGELRMAPGGLHLMLHGLKLRAGERLALRLHFADGEELDASLPVRGLADEQQQHHHHHH